MTEEKQVVSTTVSTGENETVKATAVTTGGKSDEGTSQPKVFTDTALSGVMRYSYSN